MNNLSIILYLSEALPSLRGVAIFVMIFATIATVGFFIGKTAALLEPPKDKNEAVLYRDYFSKGVRLCLTSVIISCLLVVLIPSKEAIYLIAASEAGEMVVTSEAGKELLSDIREVLDAQLQSLKPAVK